MPIGVFRGHRPGLGIGKGLAALVRFTVDLYVVERSIGFSEFVGMARVAVHVPVRVWGAAIGKEMHYLMSRLLVGGEVIPEHCRILEIGLRVSLLSMNEDGEFGWISEKENGGVIEDPIPITLLGIKFHGEASRISGGIRRPLFTSHGRKASNTSCLLTHSVEHVQ